MTVVDLSSEQLIAALRLPAEATVSQRVPKKMLAENLTSRGMATSADRKLLQEQIGVVAQMPVAAEVGSGDERDELGSG